MADPLVVLAGAESRSLTLRFLDETTENVRIARCWVTNNGVAATASPIDDTVTESYLIVADTHNRETTDPIPLYHTDQDTAPIGDPDPPTQPESEPNRWIVDVSIASEE